MAGRTVTFMLNGQDVSAEEEQTLLQAARRAGVSIPTLCHHEALAPFGACRLCVVEVEKDGRKTIEASCSYPVTAGISVATDTPRVLEARRITAVMLLNRCPQVPMIRKLAAYLGVEASPLPLPGKEEEECILCGRCVRVCREAIGKRAVSFAFRGPQRKVSSPFDSHSQDCIGCTACLFICPTGAIKAVRREGQLQLTPWQTKIALVSCSGCGRSFIPEKVLEHLGNRPELTLEKKSLCPVCRRKETAAALGQLNTAKSRVLIKK